MAKSKEELLALCNCDWCPLKAVRNPVMGDGGTASGLMFVGEAPGRNEAAQGVPFVGASGKLLDAALRTVGVKREDVYITNAVLCRPPASEEGSESKGKGDKGMMADAITACKPRFLAEVEQMAPSIMIPLGNTATSAIMGPGHGVYDMVGSTTWSEEYNCFVSPTYHPAAVLRGSTDLFDDILAVLKRVAAFSRGDVPMPPKAVDIEYRYAKGPEEIRDMLMQLLADCTGAGAEPPTLALDVETDDVRYLEDRLLLVTMSSRANNFVFDAVGLGQEPANSVFVAMLEDPWITWVLHNMAFDFNFLRYHYGAIPNVAIDTMAMALGVTERSQAIGLKRLSREWLGAPFYNDVVEKALKRKGGKMSDVPHDELVKYAAYDTHFTVRMPDVLRGQVVGQGTERLVENILIPAQRLFADMKYVGTRIDLDWIRVLESKWLPKIDEAVAVLQDLAAGYGFDARMVAKAPKGGSRLNPNSSKQLIAFFYDTLGYEPPTATTAEKGGAGRTQAGKRTTSGEFIYAHPGEPGIEELKSLRQLNKALNTYVYGILDDVWLDGRVHPDFKLAAAVTGRISITNPPLQTIPHWGIARLGVHATEELAAQLRRIFIASPGYVFVEADYSQLELRAAWHYSRDPALGEAISSGDFHRRTAAAVLHKAPEDVTKSDRFISKFVTFGVMYGRGAKSLARGELNSTVEEAQYYIDAFWSAYPGYKKWWDGVRAFVRANGWIKSSLGRKRRWSLLTRDNIEVILNQAVNMPLQSLSSDLCIMSAIRLNRIFKQNGWGRPLFLVHDSIVFEVKEEYLREAAALIAAEMSTPEFATCATFEVEVSAGPNWSDSEVLVPEFGWKTKKEHQAELDAAAEQWAAQGMGEAQ